MTHEYTILLGGHILAGADQPQAAAIAWAAGTVIALGSEAEVRAMSRGDSQFVELDGAFVIPLEAGTDPHWPTNATLETGGPADLVVLRGDPRASGDPRAAGAGGTDLPEDPIAVIRGGVVASGALPGTHDTPETVEAQRG